MTTAAGAERAALCDLFAELGPDVPTLCEGWDARDLAAHLVLREGRPDAAMGILVKPLAAYSEKVRRDVANQPWDELVERVRSGPPVWSPMRLDAVDRLANTVEFFVHHEDVRRAQQGWSPRQLDSPLVEDLTTALRRGARLLSRKAPCGLVLDVTDAIPAGAEPIVAHRGEPKVTARGAVGELTLLVYGRQQHARVELDGDPGLVDAIRLASFGI